VIGGFGAFNKLTVEYVVVGDAIEILADFLAVANVKKSK